MQRKRVRRAIGGAGALERLAGVLHFTQLSALVASAVTATGEVANLAEAVLK